MHVGICLGVFYFGMYVKASVDTHVCAHTYIYIYILYIYIYVTVQNSSYIEQFTLSPFLFTFRISFPPRQYLDS